jgi:hypothetical protein
VVGVTDGGLGVVYGIRIRSGGRDAGFRNCDSLAAEDLSSSLEALAFVLVVFPVTDLAVFRTIMLCRFRMIVVYGRELWWRNGTSCSDR